MSADQPGGELPGAGVPGGGPPGGELPARSRGVIGLLEENCTVCMLCARECPDWCIYIDSHKEPVPGTSATAAGGGGSRGRVRNVLDRFAVDFALCMYCGICIEVCPYDALFWAPDYGYAGTSILELTHERDRLRDWMATVPPPPAHDQGAPAAREALAAGLGAEPGEGGETALGGETGAGAALGDVSGN